jgi:hypothetical protein
MKRLIITLSLFTTVSSQTINEVHSYLYKLEVKHPDIVMSQIVLECGWKLDSHNATVRHNLLGWTLNGKLATFNHWTNCIRHYKVWQNKFYKGGCYFEFLECIDFGDGKCHRYAKDKNYIKRVKSILSKLEGC